MKHDPNFVLVVLHFLLLNP